MKKYSKNLHIHHGSSSAEVRYVTFLQIQYTMPIFGLNCGCNAVLSTLDYIATATAMGVRADWWPVQDHCVHDHVPLSAREEQIAAARHRQCGHSAAGATIYEHVGLRAESLEVVTRTQNDC